MRLCQAQHLAREYDLSDKSCQAFEAKYPRSTLLPVVAFTLAENAYFRLTAAEKSASASEKAKGLAPLYEEARKRAQAVIDKYPEYPKLLLVRQLDPEGKAQTEYELYDLERDPLEVDNLLGVRTGEPRSEAAARLHSELTERLDKVMEDCRTTR